MVTREILLSAAFALLSGALFAVVGRVVVRRRATGDARLAVNAFGLWWWGLASLSFLGAATNLFFAAGYGNLALYRVFLEFVLLALVMALWALIYYLLYLFTGNRRIWIPLTVFYIIYWFLLLYYIESIGITGYRIGTWGVESLPEPPPPGPFEIVITALLLLPQILGAFAYFTLYFRARERTQKFRIAVVSWSIIVWFSSSLIGTAGGREFQQSFEWQVASRVIGLLAALAILMAYKPPRWMQRRYQIYPVGEMPPGEDATLAAAPLSKGPKLVPSGSSPWSS